MVYGHLSCDFAHTINETFKWLTQLPTLMQSHDGFCGRKAPCFLRSERTTCCVFTTLLYHCLYLVFSISNGLSTPRVGRFSLHRLADLIFLLLSFYLKKKKSETELTASVLKKRSKTHKSLLCVLEVQMYLSLRVD